MSPEQLSLLAYLDQEQAKLASQWLDTDSTAARELVDWLDADMPAGEAVPDEWRKFISRVALVTLQRSALPTE